MPLLPHLYAQTAHGSVCFAESLQLCTLADLDEIGMPLSAAHRLLVHFCKAAPGAAEPVPAPPLAVLEEPMPEDPSEPALLEPEPVLNMSADVETAGRTSAEPEALAGPMAEFGAAEVLRWLETVEGLAGAQRAAIRAMLVEDELIGQDVLGWTERSLPRMLRGIDAAGAAPVLLAARDEHCSAARAEPLASVRVRRPCRGLKRARSAWRPTGAWRSCLGCW